MPNLDDDALRHAMARFKFEELAKSEGLVTVLRYSSLT
jgi:hypothetical protein